MRISQEDQEDEVQLTSAGVGLTLEEHASILAKMRPSERRRALLAFSPGDQAVVLSYMAPGTRGDTMGLLTDAQRDRLAQHAFERLSYFEVPSMLLSLLWRETGPWDY